IAVVPPIPSDSVSTAATVNTGERRNWRRAYRRFLRTVHMKSCYGQKGGEVPRVAARNPAAQNKKHGFAVLSLRPERAARASVLGRLPPHVAHRAWPFLGQPVFDARHRRHN